MNIDCVSLFPSNLFKTIIEPTSFDKSGIIDSVLRNYELQKERNEWDDNSHMHHYYNDWDNELFEKVDLSSITDQYKDIYQNILNIMFNKPIEFKVVVENITVHKGGNTDMAVHNHINDNVFLSGVHYIKCDETSSKLTFVNPLTYSEYPNISIKNITSTSLDGSDVVNSSYFKEWNYAPIENEILIFPSYLNHRVYPSKIKNDEFRIAIVTNLQIFPKTE
jgi:hypothetical protein